MFQIYTLSPISVSGLSTVRYKTILNTGSVEWAGAAPPTYIYIGEVFVMALGSKYVDL